MPSMRIHQSEANVVLEFDGKVAIMPWDKALELCKAIRDIAKMAEEFANKNAIIADGAVLLRAGFGVGLTNDAYLRKEIKKKAETDRELRRMLPTIPSAEVVGVPTVRKN